MTPRDPIDDELGAYLRQRASVQVPGDLVARALAGDRRPAPQPRPWLRLGAAMAAVLVVAAIAATQIPHLPAGVALPATAPGGASSAPDTAALETAANATAAPSVAGTRTQDPGLAAHGFPAEVLGLPVLSVAEARALIGDPLYQGRAMAVGGWWSQGSGGMSCPAPSHFTSVVEGYCSLTALAPTDARVDVYRHTENSSSESFNAPEDALKPRITAETAGWDEVYTDVPDVDAHQLPRRAVLVGHAGDPRAWMCVAAVIESCKKEFVVDAFAWVEGRTPKLVRVPDGAHPLSSVSQVVTAVDSMLPKDTLVTLLARTDVRYLEYDPIYGIDHAPFWLARSVVGAVDAAGTSRLVETLVDDEVGGGSIDVIDMAYRPGAEPGSVQYVADGDFYHQFGELPSLFAAIYDGRGNRLQQTYLQSLYSTPAVLPAGDYRVISWSGEPSSAVPNPTPPAKSTCEAPVHVTTDAVTNVLITWNADLSCRINPDAPEPSPAY